MCAPDVIRYNGERLHNNRSGEELSMHVFTRATMAGIARGLGRSGFGGRRRDYRGIFRIQKRLDGGL